MQLSLLVCSLLFFFFKQKTAYEMRISDWSSDVCSSDLLWTHAAPLRSGEVASTLIRGGPAGHAIPGFLLLYAVDARSPLLYLPQRQPLRIRDGIEIAPETAGGPFLALIRCEATADGRAQAVKACAMPI